MPEFDATDNSFWRWRQQLELLRGSCHMDENAMRILITFRLKGFALTWFHLRTEHVTMAIDSLLEEMRQLFNLRPGKLSLRREFKARVWRGDEPFCDYYYDKVALANRLPIAEAELVDYVVERITDLNLRNQARLIGFQTKTALLRAFEKVNYGPKKVSDWKRRKEGARPAISGGAGPAPMRSKPMKCYR